MERGYICIAHGGRGEDAADEVDVSSRGRRNQAGNNKALPEYRIEGEGERKRGNTRFKTSTSVLRCLYGPSFSFLRNEYSFVTRSTLSQYLGQWVTERRWRQKETKKKKKKGVETRVCGGRDGKREGVGKCSRRNNEKEDRRGGKKWWNVCKYIAPPYEGICFSTKFLALVYEEYAVYF